ncbi:MAG TPA: hypothetical protein VG266_09470 [Candidatus Dormibacteraeota bacterium]|jgi:hypothetical protein|nr:hypothetical protein [Candidatus Dormibacteraeota bacterium]
MSLLRQAPRPTAGSVPRSRGRRLGRFLKKWAIPVIAGVTPVGLMVINIAAFLVKHLDQFRWTIAVLSFLSGMMLNTYVGLNLYRWVQRRAPDFALVKQQNEELMVAVGMGVITVITFVLAYETYVNLTVDSIPGGFTFIYGTLQIASAVLIKLTFDRDRVRHRTASAVSSRPPAQPPGQPQSPPARPSGGYTPPPYLPPS